MLHFLDHRPWLCDCLSFVPRVRFQFRQIDLLVERFDNRTLNRRFLLHLLLSLLKFVQDLLVFAKVLIVAGIERTGQRKGLGFPRSTRLEIERSRYQAVGDGQTTAALTFHIGIRSIQKNQQGDLTKEFFPSEDREFPEERQHRRAMKESLFSDGLTRMFRSD